MAVLRAGPPAVSQDTLLYRHGSGACAPVRSVLAAQAQLAQAVHACLVANLAFRDASKRQRRCLAEVPGPGQPRQAGRPERVHLRGGCQCRPAAAVVSAGCACRTAGRDHISTRAAT